MFSTNQLMRYGCLIVICLATVLVLTTNHSESLVASYGLTKSTRNDAGPVGTCNKSGTYTQYKSLQSNGTVSMHWSPSLPLNNKFGYRIRVNGYGWIDATINHAVTSTRFNTIGSGSHSFTRGKVGTFYVFLVIPRSKAVTEQIISDKITVSYNNEAYDTYSWTASGKVTLQAVYWKASAGYPFMGGSWENFGPAVAHKYNSQGSWILEGKLLCPKCSQEVTHFSQHHITCSSSSCGERYWRCITSELNEHTATSHTVQNNGGGTVSSGGSSSSCYNKPTPNWCSDTGSCTTRSRSGVPGECGHNFCCCAPRGSPIYNGGSSSGGGNNDNGGGGNGGGGNGGGGDSGSAVTCSNCSARVSSSTAHQATCDLGHTYWTCGSQYSVNLHSVRHSNRTCRRCGTTFNSRTNGTCNSRWGTTYSYHWE